MVRGPLRRLASGALLVSLMAGCDRNEIKVYRVAKEPAAPPTASAPGDLPAGHPDVGAPAQPRLAWKTPEGWNEVTPGEMRVASFNIKDSAGKQADVSVIPLPGDAGGDSANVNRWRGQVGLQPLSAGELEKLAEKIEVAGQAAELYDLSGQTPDKGGAARILATIQHRDGTAWFFKMTGDDKIVEQQKSAFIEFLKSLRFEAAETAALPAAHPPVDGGMNLLPLPAAEPATDGNRPDWQVPSGWREAPAGQFLTAKFMLDGEGGAQAAVNVSRAAGDGGGLAANVNRWRKQLGLGELSGTDLNQTVTPMEISGGQATLVDLTGTDARTGQPARLVGAIVPQDNQTWFFKLMGDAKVVERERQAFSRFVQSAKY